MANRSVDFRLYRCMTPEMMDADNHGAGSSLSGCTKLKAAASGSSLSRCTKLKAAAADEEKALKKMKMEEEAKVKAAVQEEEPERKVVDGKRMVKKMMPMEKVLRILAIDPKPLIINAPGADRNPLFHKSMELRKVGIAKIREVQDTIREDLRTKGYVPEWVTDDDE